MKNSEEKEKDWNEVYPIFIKKAYLSKNAEQTKKRLRQMVDIGMTEIQIANFGVTGIMSGLYIEMVWNYSDSEFQSYIDWVKDLIEEKKELLFTLSDGTKIKKYDIIECEGITYQFVIENSKFYLISDKNDLIDGSEMKNILSKSIKKSI